jgi:hypothetical protein
MRFEDLYVLYEGSLRLIKGNFDKPLSAKEYNQGIKSNIANSDKYGYNSVRYFIGKPGQRDSNYISLYYQIVASSEMPAKHFKYEIPDTTLQKFRTQREIFNRTKPSFLAGRSNVFYYNGKPIPKIFAESNLEEVMGALINANEYFIKNYGKDYSFLGNVYRMGQDTTFSKIAASWERNKQNIKNLPKQFKDYWANL